jgi:hypothetical protein
MNPRFALGATKRTRRGRISEGINEHFSDFWPSPAKRLFQEWRQYSASAQCSNGIESRSRAINGKATVNRNTPEVNSGKTVQMPFAEIGHGQIAANSGHT